VGVDFRAARAAGEDCGAQIVLGDRPVEITLERCWRGMDREEKWRAAQLVGNTMFAKVGDGVGVSRAPNARLSSVRPRCVFRRLGCVGPAVGQRLLEAGASGRPAPRAVR